MVIGVPGEIKTHEYRVSLTPAGALTLVGEGHRVLVERGAGAESGFEDVEYEGAGAEISEREKVYGKAELILKVKEPLPAEYGLLREGQAVFTYLHLAANPGLTSFLLDKRIAAFGYETLSDGVGLPLLAPMSEIAGRMAPLVAAYYLQKPMGGEGVLPAGAVGVPPAEAVVIGAGVVGSNAVRVAHALGMEVTVLNRGIERLRKMDELYAGEVHTLTSTPYNVAEAVMRADILVGAVLVSGARAPICVTREMLGEMKKGSVIVDVSVDQGGCVETSRPTTHDDPVFVEEGIIHYCVANMPGAYPRTSTIALTNSTLPYVSMLAREGIKKAASGEGPFLSALNTYEGRVVNEALLK